MSSPEAESVRACRQAEPRPAGRRVFAADGYHAARESSSFRSISRIASDLDWRPEAGDPRSATEQVVFSLERAADALPAAGSVPRDSDRTSRYAPPEIFLGGGRGSASATRACSLRQADSRHGRGARRRLERCRPRCCATLRSPWRRGAALRVSSCAEIALRPGGRRALTSWIPRPAWVSGASAKRIEPLDGHSRAPRCVIANPGDSVSDGGGFPLFSTSHGARR